MRVEIRVGACPISAHSSDMLHASTCAPRIEKRFGTYPEAQRGAEFERLFQLLREERAEPPYLLSVLGVA